MELDFVDLPVPRPLLDVALDLERHVAARGWDRPPTLFALVSTAMLAELPGADPTLSAEAGVDELSAIEQDDIAVDVPLEDLLGHLGWPPEVLGAALAVERVVLPPETATDLPEDPREAARLVEAHPGAIPIRLVVAVLGPGYRPAADTPSAGPHSLAGSSGSSGADPVGHSGPEPSGDAHRTPPSPPTSPSTESTERRAVCLVRRRDDDRDEAVALARDMAPGLVAALRVSLEP